MQSRISAARLEGAEAEFMYQYESMAPRSAVTSLGIVTARIGGGVVLSMRNDVTGYWNKALGFGFAEPVTRDLIDRVIDFYKSERSPRAVLQIAGGPANQLGRDLSKPRYPRGLAVVQTDVQC